MTKLTAKSRNYTLKERETDNIATIIREQNLVARLERLVRHLGISMSLMSDSDVLTRLARGGMNAPAATAERGMPTIHSRGGRYVGISGKTVPKRLTRKAFLTTFDIGQMPKLDGLAVWLGVAWHELGHVIWSVFNGHITVGLNLLEDARIETLLIQKYPKTRGALMAALAYLLKLQANPDVGSGVVDYQADPVFMYAWVAGRTHLSRRMRTDVRRAAEKVRPGIPRQIEAIFREYLRMGTQYNSDKAHKLATRLNQLLGASNRGLPTCEGLSSGKYTDKQLGEDSEVDPSTIREIREIGKVDLAESDDDGSGTPGGDTPDEGDTPDDTDNDDSGKGAGATFKEKQAAESKARAEKIRRELEQEAAKDTSLAKEVAQLSKYIESGIGVDAKVEDMEVRPPTPEAKRLANKIRTYAGQFNDDSGKGVIRKVDHGRLRPMRYERTRDIDISYDAWEPGLSQEMYIILMIDQSGSMRNAPISEVLYALEVGLGDVATVHPVLWSDSFVIPPLSNAPNRMLRVRPNGGTDPTDGLSYAHHKLLTHSAANKLLVLYTDGEFNSSGRGLDGKVEYVNNYETTSAYMKDLLNKGVDVQLLDEQGKGKLSQLDIPRDRIHTVNGITDLPKIVEKWTRIVLTTR